MIRMRTIPALFDTIKRCRQQQLASKHTMRKQSILLHQGFT
jgi:hypothetical protein